MYVSYMSERSDNITFECVRSTEYTLYMHILCTYMIYSYVYSHIYYIVFLFKK